MKIELTHVASNQIHAIGHDAATNTLAIQFRQGRDRGPGAIYHYANFTAEKFAQFLAAESKGKWFADNIKNNEAAYPYERQPPPDAKPAEENPAEE